MNRLLLLLLFAAGLLFLPSFADPCGTPLTYRVGDIDGRFSISRGQLLAALRRAEAVWEDAARMNLFELAEDGDIAVHLVYDQRQETAEEIERRKETIEEITESAESLKERHEAATRRYESERKKYLKAKETFDELLAEHNRDVENANSRGGASGAQLEALKRESAELQVSRDELERERLEVNALAERANEILARFNALVGEVNDNVAAVNVHAGEEFKQGRYVRDGAGERIYIFEFLSTPDLVHVLAHELGHALGLDHDPNAESIMYGLNSTQALEPTESDMAALRTVCRL